LDSGRFEEAGGLNVMSHAHLGILDLAVEDWYGLWEIAGHFPDGEPASARPPSHDELVRALRELMSCVLVKLAVRTGPEGRADINRSSTGPDLDQPEHWRVPEESEPQYLVGATPAGESAYAIVR
jgi:hypothetical protein